MAPSLPASISLIVPAAGSGWLGRELPKALVRVAGASLLEHALRRLTAAVDFLEIVVAAPAGREKAFEGILAAGAFQTARVIRGGNSRQESVRFGLEALARESRMVCVHDAARPLVASPSVRAVVAAAEGRPAATLASPLVDSLRRETQGGGSEAMDRSGLWLVETPQVFAREVLTEAHARAREEGWVTTDDASLVETAGYPVRLVAGEGNNFKVTRPDDLPLAEFLLAATGAAAD